MFMKNIFKSISVVTNLIYILIFLIIDMTIFNQFKVFPRKLHSYH